MLYDRITVNSFFLNGQNCCPCARLVEIASYSTVSLVVTLKVQCKFNHSDWLNWTLLFECNINLIFRSCHIDWYWGQSV